MLLEQFKAVDEENGAPDFDASLRRRRPNALPPPDGLPRSC